MKVKICGITDVETALLAVEAGADALGFVFAESKRKITPQKAREIILYLPPEIEKVGVFVNERKLVMEEIAEYCGLTMLQLHGEEAPEMCEGFSLPIIKAFGISSEKDIEQAMQYSVSYMLADSPKGVYRGGNGVSFDWSILSKTSLREKKIILAGGLTPENVADAIQTVRPYMVDVSSGVESNGVKDVEKIKAFIHNAKGERG
jgi:phosphoribosylanthranilate isomerase